MLPLIFTAPTARLITGLVFGTWLISELATAHRVAAGDRVQDQGTRLFLAASLSVALVSAGIVARRFTAAGIAGPAWIIFGAGCTLALAGVALRRWAIAALGRFFTRDVMIREGHQLVTAGPYRRLRHPSYSGTLLTVMGIGVILQNWLSLAIVTAGFFVSHLPRILHEERVLEANFGEPYRTFEKTRKRLIPMVW